MKDIVITFDDLAAGDIVGMQYQGDGVRISSGTDGRPPMIFDTAFPIGRDGDLGADDRGNVLILSDGGDQSDPDGNAGGGTLVFEFEHPSDVQSLRFLDIEDTGGAIRLYGAGGALIERVPVPVTGMGGQELVEFGADGAVRMEVTLAGSGAVDDLVFRGSSHGVASGPAGAEAAGIVWPGDPDRDLADGGDGADLLFGDQALGGDDDREAFHWAEAPDQANPDGRVCEGDAVTGFTQNTGTVSVTFTIMSGHNGRIAGMGGDADGVDESVAYGLEFSDDVTNVAFRINDVDLESSVRVMAYQSTGRPAEIELTAGRKVMLRNDGGDEAVTSERRAAETPGAYSMLVNIPGPVSQIEIVHEAAGGEASAINITNVYYDPVVAGEDKRTGGAGVDGRSDGTTSDLFPDGAGGDIDRLDLRGTGVRSITYTSEDREDGIVTFRDGSTMTFAEIEAVTPCFTPGTRIATARGERLVEELRVGDKIITRDNGLQEIRWIGQSDTTRKRPEAQGRLEPILIAKGSLGNDLPERDMLVSPNHRILVSNDRTELYFDEKEVLVAAKHLIGSRGIEKSGVQGVTYVHFMCDRHEVVLSDGTWTESFQPGDRSLKGLGSAQRQEIYDIFPELKERDGLEGYRPARVELKKHEARLLMR
ncbi:Hint domain-containing protein [Aestuariibius sp. 2305UL40-4]|uniref:Hint domain-containing protein n=1 Tax=Aestuariibius violaceus TaxID=3234132 RepID=UPI00345E17F5